MARYTWRGDTFETAQALLDLMSDRHGGAALSLGDTELHVILPPSVIRTTTHVNVYDVARDGDTIEVCDWPKRQGVQS